MSSENLPAIGDQPFESLKQLTPHGAEYWSARDLQPLLGYSQWRRFEGAIQKAITSCEQSGNEPAHHFASAGKMIAVGKGGQREVPDFQMSRFACYLIAQNGDPRKPEIALAQKYFAIQTRRQELSDQQAADLERLELRKQASEEFKMLTGAACDPNAQRCWQGSPRRDSTHRRHSARKHSPRRAHPASRAASAKHIAQVGAR
ncbi:MAG: BRO family protein [Planctomycetaceae bacterium]